MTPVLNVIVALSCEAKPLIDYYRLSKKPVSLYPHFYTEGNPQTEVKINLVVSGIGMLNMAAACGWLAAKTASPQTIWLNVGTAGHGELPVGELALVVACGDTLSDNIHYPSLVAKWSGKSIMLNSNSQACVDYSEAVATDMEASAFYFAAKKSASTELVQSLKIISDNSQADIEALNAPRISALIAPHVATIDQYAKTLIALLPMSSECFKEFQMQHLHCTVAQQQQFVVLAEKLQNVEIDKQQIQQILDNAASMREVLSQLNEKQRYFQPSLNSIVSSEAG